jgi:hypothetical protein
MKIKKRTVCGLFLLGILSCSCSIPPEPYPPMQMGLGVMQNLSPVGELTKNLPVRQTFAAPQDGLCGVALFMATYARPNPSNLTIRIMQAEGEKALKTFQIDSSKLFNNSWLLLPIDPVLGAKDKAFWVDIQGDGEPGKSPTIWMNPQATFAESRGKLFINAKESPGSLCFQLYFALKPSEKKK